jgi:glycine cleavage system H protein
VAVNTDVAAKLEHLADDPYGAGWFIKIKIANEAGLAALLGEAAYKKQCEEEPH